jgi:hypothetical protein
MIVEIASTDLQGLGHFNGGEAMVVGNFGGQTSRDFGYGKTVPFPTAFCVACPWRSSYDDGNKNNDDGASLSGDKTALLGEEAPVLPMSASPALSMALWPSPLPAAPLAPLYPALPASALPVSVPPSSALPVLALPVS